MNRAERTRKAAEKLERAALRSVMRATNATADRLTWGVIRAGQVASKRFKKAQLLLQLAEDREQAAKGEKRKKKLTKDWWRGK